MPKIIPSIVTFAGTVTPEHSAPDPAKLLSGRPVHTTQNHFADPAQRFFCGVWSSTEGKWRVSYAEHEFCALLEGHVRLTGDDGAVTELRAGDSFVIPAGFEGTWETVAACRKLYVIYLPENPAPATNETKKKKRRSAPRKKKPSRPRRKRR